MRICVDCRSLVSGEQTGVGQVVRLFLDEIREDPQGHEWILLTTGMRQPATDMGVWCGPHVTHIHRRIPNKLLHLCTSVFGAPTLSQLVGGTVDHLVVPGLHFFAVDAVPTTVIVHDLSFLISPRWYSWKRRVWHWVIRPQRSIMNAAHIVVPSQQTKQDILSFYGVQRTPISVVPWRVQKNATRNSIRPCDNPYLLYLGTIEPRKNVGGLLAAYQESGLLDEGIELHLAGSRGWGSRHLHKQMNSMPGVTYHGYVSAAQKEALLEHAHAVLYPSFYEGYGLPPLEAVQYSVPLVVSHHPALPEVLGMAAVYVDPYSTTDIANALRTVSLDADTREEVVQEMKRCTPVTVSLVETILSHTTPTTSL